MLKNKIHIISILSGMIFLNTVEGQDLSNMGFNKGIKATGGVNLSGIFYHTSDSIARRESCQLLLSGNLNLNLFGYDAPFSFTYSNSQRSYTQPFNRLSFTPQYKWIKVYLGYTSMSFSPYTLSGHSFKGCGVELNPGNIRLALMAGQLKKGIAYNPLSESSVLPSYKRMGYGIKIGYEKGASSIAVNIFTAKDDENSIQKLPDIVQLRPMQNTAVGISGHTSLFGHLTLEGEYSLSILNSNTSLEVFQPDTLTSVTGDDLNSLKHIGVRSFDARSAAIGYQAAMFGIALRYERISPDYQTLGAYYFNNDMENFTIVPNFRLLEGKLSFSGNAGIQQNNLDRKLVSTTKRWVGAGNINFNPSERWNMLFSYSNFSTYTNMKPQTDPFFKNNMDSLNFYQVSNQFGGSLNYTFGKKDAPGNININTTYQEAKEANNTAKSQAVSGFLTANASYSRLLRKTGLSVSLSYNINASKTSEMRSLYQGPGLNLSKMFMKKTLRTALNSVFNINTVNSRKGPPVMSVGLIMSFSPAKTGDGSHRLNFNLSCLHRFPSEMQKQNKTEITGNLNYAYTF